MNKISPRHEIAVVMVTIGRESLLRAVRSVFSQDFNHPIQILIGVDTDNEKNIAIWKAILAKECPEHIDIFWLELGYSTSKRHGGIHHSFYGGSLRSALTLLADAPYVTYLDDDDWFLDSHLSTVHSALANYPHLLWTHTYCYYADGNSGKLLCVDELESTGTGSGLYKEKFGGFVRLSGLTINVLKTLPFIHSLSSALNSSGDGEDRVFFDLLKDHNHARINVATVACALDPKDNAHAVRMNFIQSRIGHIHIEEKKGSSR